MSLNDIMTIILVVIMVFSILGGFIQGARKNGFKLVSTILFWVVFFTTAPLLASSDIWYDSNIYVSLVLDSKYENLMTFIGGSIASAFNVDPELLKDPAFENTIIAIALSIIRIVYAIVLSIVYKIFMKIIYWIFFAKVCKTSKKQVKKLQKKIKKLQKKEKPTEKYQKKLEIAEKRYAKNKRNKVIGLGTGLLRGAISCFFILAIVNSTVAILPNLNKGEDINASTEQNGNKEVTIYDFIVSQFPECKGVIDYIAEYQKSNLSTISSIKIGGESLDSLLIDAILTGKKENYTFSIRKDLQQVVKIATHAFELTNGFDMENFDYLNLDEDQVVLVKEMIYILSDIDLIKNLGSLAVGLALSMESIKSQIPEGIISEELYKDIDWSKELKSVADLVASVYSLGNLKELDYTQVPEDSFVAIINSLASLQSIQLVGTVGSFVGLSQTEIGEERLEELKVELAEIAWNEDIGSLANLYDEYKSLMSYYKESTKDNQNFDILEFIGGAPINDVQSVIDTILETTFLEKVMPDVINLLKANLDPIYAALLNPNIILSSQWKQELDTIFTIIKELKGSDNVNPFKDITNFDFSLLLNISTSTILGSELLSFAVIDCFVKGSNGEGIASILNKFVVVPDYLKEFDSLTNKYAADWYGNDGELYVMFDTLKRAASRIENLKYSAGSIMGILSSIDVNALMNSDVLYCSIDNLLKSNNSIIVIPQKSLVSTEITINNEKINMVSKDEISDILSIVCGDNNLLDLESLYVYYRVDEEGNETKLDGKPEDDDYVVKIDFSDTNKLIGLLTSKKIYDKQNNVDNTTKLFSSSILRATISNYMEQLGKDIIATPSKLSSQAVVKSGVYNPGENVILDNNNEISILSALECGNLIKALSTLELDIASIQENPLCIIDAFKTEEIVGDEVNITYEENKVKDIFTSKQQQTYSELLHATLSKYILDFSSQTENSDLEIVVPSTVIEATTNYITSDEIVSLVKALVYVDIQNLTGENASDNIADIILTNKYIDQAFDSVIFRATISKYVSSNDTIVIPESDVVVIDDMDVIKTESIVSLIKTIKALEINSFNDLLEDPMNLLDCFKNDDESFNENLANSIFKENGENYSSILHATLSKTISTLSIADGFEIVIPSTIYSEKTYDGENKYLSSNEVINLLKAFVYVKDEFENISDSSINVEKIISSLITTNKISYTYDSVIFRASITSYLMNMETQILELPSSSYITEGGCNIVKKEELTNLVNAFNSLNLSFNTISEDPLSIIDAFKYEDGSYNETLTESIFKETSLGYSSILHATLSVNIDKIAEETTTDSFAIVVPEIHETDGYLPDEEIISLIKALTFVDIDALTNSSDVLTEINNCMKKDGFTDTFESKIFRVSISLYLIDMEEIEVPQSSTEIVGNKKAIKLEELTNLVNAFNSLDLSFNTISEDPLSIIDAFKNEDGSYNETLTESIFKETSDKYSYILHATLSVNIDKIAEETTTDSFAIVVPEIHETDGYLPDEEIISLIKALTFVDIDALTNSSDVLTEIDAYMNDAGFTDTLDSIVFRASITSYLRGVGDQIITTPTSTIEEIGNCEVIYKEDLSRLIGAFRLMDVKLSDLTTNPFTLIKPFKNTNGTFNQDLADKIFLDNETNNNYSYILHATLSEFIHDYAEDPVHSSFKIVIPVNVYRDDGYILDTEIINLTKTFIFIDIESLTSGESNVASLVDDYMNDDNFEKTLDSIIYRATLTNYIVSLNENGDIIVPNEAKDEYQTITKEEMLLLKDAIHCLGAIDEVMSLDNLRLDQFAENKETIFASHIIKASFSNYIHSYTTTEDESVVKIVISDGLYDGTYIDDDELYAFVDAVALIHPGELSEFNTFSKNDIAKINKEKITTFFTSKIITATTSPMITSELIQIGFEIPENVYDSCKVNDVETRYIKASELINLYVAMDIFLAEGESITDSGEHFSYESILNNSSLFDNSDEDKVLLLCKSYIISHNIVIRIKEENTANLNGILLLDLHADGSEIKWHYDEETSYEGELYELLYALNDLKSGGYYSALTSLDPNSTELSIFTGNDGQFIKILTNNHILCDSIPSMLSNFKTYIEGGNSLIDTDKIYVKSADENNWTVDSEYWGGKENYKDGQLYKFFNSITAANRIKGYNQTTQIQEMIADVNIILDCEVTAPMIEGFLTNEELVSTMNNKVTRYMLGTPASDCGELKIPEAENGKINWETEQAQTYLHDFVTIYLTAISKGISL